MSYPVDVEFDLIFPRPGGTYKRIYPFPIIYGIRNAAAIWPFQLSFVVMIQAGAPDELDGIAYLPPFEGDGPGATPYINSRGELPADQDPFYAILPFNTVVNATHTDKVWMNWSITVSNCTDPPSLYEKLGGLGGYEAYGNFSFNLSDDGELPDSALSGDECPELLHVGRVLGGSQNRGGECGVMGEEPGEPDPCRLRPTQGLRTRVLEAMLAEAGCKEGTPWPDEERKGNCPREDWEEESDEAGFLRCSVTGIVAAVAAVLSVLF
ncbi:hypothetical protein IMZ48_10875 [Candidatus Bathyarchaeota archaeon]|nr:hypothetical protein [Candidatus Bathyarchaeota archaeon]